jgi:hypothetical protein
MVFLHVDPLLGKDRERSNCTTAVAKLLPVNSNRGKVFSVRSLPMAAQATMQYVVPPLSNNCTATDKRCFLCGPCRKVISRQLVRSKSVSGVRVSEELVGELVRGLLRFSCCEL